MRTALAVLGTLLVLGLVATADDVAFAISGFAANQCHYAQSLSGLNWLPLWQAANSDFSASPLMLPPDGPTYGCWPTGAICEFNCDEWNWWCFLYCLLLGNPDPYACEAGCQYICCSHLGCYTECRDIRPAGCRYDIRYCPVGG